MLTQQVFTHTQNTCSSLWVYILRVHKPNLLTLKFISVRMFIQHYHKFDSKFRIWMGGGGDKKVLNKKYGAWSNHSSACNRRAISNYISGFPNSW